MSIATDPVDELTHHAQAEKAVGLIRAALPRLTVLRLYVGADGGLVIQVAG